MTGNLIRKPKKDIHMYIPREVRSKRIDGKPNPKTEKGYMFILREVRSKRISV